MSLPKTQYRCSKCEYLSTKWMGKCPNCNSWNSMIEEIKANSKNALEQKNFSVSGSSLSLKINSFREILDDKSSVSQGIIYPFSASALNEFWSKGITSGSMTLLAGEPGLGKSTFSLQILRAIYNGTKDKLKLLYITAEESSSELAKRSARLDIPDAILCLQANNFTQIERTLLNEKPNLVIIDSIQTIYNSDISANPGSITQVSTLTNQFLAIAKSQNIAIILVGHVTKEGQIAGPKTLEHMVDSVLLLEASESSKYRTLSFSKHRFGTTDNLLLLKMEQEGLLIVTDPSLALLENLEMGIGICYGLSMDKNQPFVVEIQALISDSNNNSGKREAIGVKNSKLNIILAIAEKYLDLDCRGRDVYVQISGLPKNVIDDSLDLPILLAIISSLRGIHVSNLIDTWNQKSKNSGSAQANNIQLNTATKIIKQAFAGRLTFSGTLRNATNSELRQKTAKKLGFDYNPKIKIGNLGV